ncbi:hypothetical protein K505DRAFT_242768 [Melanomma pulvis-pyrius CBS 109.77]|uniref:Uncharacterized protein n=1 Tax=Melanomma pulvis-pyrius CBS 109.77 TaxID=1314802 RepID=A0A6A6XEL0_9PLEO|nr:hypothetical protein K505DRAFT_242768 [Melanomma pulvis-pyrius CBS 109.77]
MHYLTTTLTLLASISSAHPLIPRQGSSYYAVGLKYSGGGCTDQSLIYADPIYTKNGCAPLTRPAPYEPQPPITPVVSYKLTSLCSGGSVKLYSTVDCTGTAYSAPLNQCVQGNSPFVSVYVTCPI